jgi:exodeoxyribonuclease VIII
MFKNCRIVAKNVNSDAYHGQETPRGHDEYIMSPSSIKAFMGCPSRWIGGYEPPETEAKDWGNLVDCLILTPSQFNDRYAVRPDTYATTRMECPVCKSMSESKSCRKCNEERKPVIVELPWNGNATKCEEWLAGQRDGVNVISKDEALNAQDAVRRLLLDATIAAFIAASDTQVHVAGEWHDKATGLVIPVQCLIDLVPRLDSEFRKLLGDLKTTRNAGQRQFARWCFTAGYHVQAAFDLEIYKAATGEDRTNWAFILSENFPPFEPGKRMLAESFTDIGKLAFEHALARYARCLKTGEWPSYDPADEFSMIEAEPYMEFESLSLAMEADQQQESQESEPIEEIYA